jgi:hypothetical protein
MLYELESGSPGNEIEGLYYIITCGLGVADGFVGRLKLGF